MEGALWLFWCAVIGSGTLHGARKRVVPVSGILQ